MSFARGKVALVTGGASGIGLCMVKKLLQSELKGVTIADIDAEAGNKIVCILSEKFGANRILFVKTDVTRHQDVEDAFKKTVEIFANLDIVINCAGIFNDRAYEKSIAINLCGTIRTSFMAVEDYLPRFRNSSEALLINIASICGLNPWAGLPVYVATKYGVLGFSRSLGTEEHYKRTGVRVLTICPGVTETALLLIEENQYYNLSYKDAEQKLFKRPAQKPEFVADALEQIVREGETGSAWVVEGETTYKVDFPDLLKPF